MRTRKQIARGFLRPHKIILEKYPGRDSGISLDLNHPLWRKAFLDNFASCHMLWNPALSFFSDLEASSLLIVPISSLSVWLWSQPWHCFDLWKVITVQPLTKQLIFCMLWPESLPLCLDHMSKVWARLELKVTFNSVGPVWTCQTTHPHPSFVSHLFVQFYSCPACFHIGL